MFWYFINYKGGENLKRKLLLVLVIIGIVVFSALQVAAAPGGIPAAHGADGKTFGGIVKSLATSYPGAVRDHISPGGG